MGLLRLLFWAAIIFATFWFLRRLFAKLKSAKQTPPPEPSAAPMVRCHQCGVHVPQSQALTDQQRWYCSQAHLTQGQSHGDR